MAFLDREDCLNQINSWICGLNSSRQGRKFRYVDQHQAETWLFVGLRKLLPHSSKSSWKLKGKRVQIVLKEFQKRFVWLLNFG